MGPVVDAIVNSSPHTVKGCALDASYPKSGGAPKRPYHEQYDEQPSGDDPSTAASKDENASSDPSKTGEHGNKSDHSKDTNKKPQSSTRHTAPEGKYAGRGRGRGRGRGGPWPNQWYGPPGEGMPPMMSPPGKKTLLPFPPPGPMDMLPHDGSHDYQNWGPYRNPPPMGYDRPFDDHTPYYHYGEAPPPVGGAYNQPPTNQVPPGYPQPMAMPEGYDQRTDYPPHHQPIHPGGDPHGDSRPTPTSSKYYNSDPSSYPHQQAQPTGENPHPPDSHYRSPLLPSTTSSSTRPDQRAATSHSDTAPVHSTSYQRGAQPLYPTETESSYYHNTKQSTKQTSQAHSEQYYSGGMGQEGYSESSHSSRNYPTHSGGQPRDQQSYANHSQDRSSQQNTTQDKGYSQYMRERFQQKQEHGSSSGQSHTAPAQGYKTSRGGADAYQYSSHYQQEYRETRGQSSTTSQHPTKMHVDQATHHPQQSVNTGTPQSIHDPQAVSRSQQTATHMGRQSAPTTWPQQPDTHQSITRSQQPTAHHTHSQPPPSHTQPPANRRAQVGYGGEVEAGYGGMVEGQADVPNIDTKALKAILTNFDNIYSAYVRRSQSKD